MNDLNFFGNWPGCFDRAFHKITATDCDTVRRSWIFDAGIKRKVAKGKRRKERPDSPWAGEFVRGMGTTDSFCLITLLIIQEGTMDWERVRLALGVWRPAKHILDRKRGARRPAQRPGPPSRCFHLRVAATARQDGAIKRLRSPKNKSEIFPKYFRLSDIFWHPLTLHFWKAEKWVGQKNGLSDVSAPPYFCHPHSARQSVLIRGL